MAIKRGVCHLAGSHLLDPQDGSYNLSYIKKFLAQVEVKLINLVMRDQGLIVRRGNPKGIEGIEDLARSDISFINRQAGSGTRILLDFRLNQIGIDPADIRGYHHEEFTHMAVAVAVLSGTVDTGLGIREVATTALGLPSAGYRGMLCSPELFVELAEGFCYCALPSCASPIPPFCNLRQDNFEQDGMR